MYYVERFVIRGEEDNRKEATFWRNTINRENMGDYLIAFVFEGIEALTLV